MTADVRSHQPAASRRRTRAVAVGGAALATVLLWAVAQVAGVDLKVDQNDGKGPTEVGLPLVLGFSLIAALLGWGLLALLERFAPRRAAVVWTVTAVVVLLLSLAGPFSVEASAGTKTLLALMHAAVGAVLIPGLARSASGAS